MASGPGPNTRVRTTAGLWSYQTLCPVRPPETLETERLRLRPPTMEDAEWIFSDYAQDPEVTKYMDWRPHESIVMTHEFLRHTLEGWRKGKEFHWVITDKASGDRLGMIAIWLEKPHRAQFGYVLARKHWGNGYATEAARAVVEWAMSLPGIFRVWAVCDIENRASARVLEKADLEFEGILHRWTMHSNISDEPRDVLCYARVK